MTRPRVPNTPFPLVEDPAGPSNTWPPVPPPASTPPASNLPSFGPPNRDILPDTALVPPVGDSPVYTPPSPPAYRSPTPEPPAPIYVNEDESSPPPGAQIVPFGRQISHLAHEPSPPTLDNPDISMGEYEEEEETIPKTVSAFLLSPFLSLQFIA
jgi:hypothetical protein